MNNPEKTEKVKKKLSKEELLVQYRSALMVLKMKSKMGQLVQTHQIKELKKGIARLLTKSRPLVEKENENK